MSGLTVFLLLAPGTALDRVWKLNLRAHADLSFMGWPAVATVCAACATAALGLWFRKHWGFWTALLILAVNMSGDTMNAILARDWRTLIGIPVAGAMLAYLISRRRLFQP